MKSKSCNIKKTVFARFDEGEDLLLTLKALAEKHNIKSGFFNFIGGLKTLAFGLLEKDGKYRQIKINARNCIELLPTFGNVTQKEGQTLIHAHIIASEEEKGIAMGGHLVEGSIIYPFAEVVMHEVDTVIDRAHDPKVNLWKMQF